MKFKIKLKRLGIVTLTALMLFTNINIKAFEGIINDDKSFTSIKEEKEKAVKKREANRTSSLNRPIHKKIMNLTNKELS